MEQVLSFLGQLHYIKTTEILHHQLQVPQKERGVLYWGSSLFLCMLVESRGLDTLQSFA